MNNIEPTLQDINTVFSNNPTAAQQLQIVALTRTVKELQERIAELEKELENKTTASKNGKGNAKELEPVT
tara:strand:+ start:7111 stop:7320 length:210 start_codon:yes stop_codon:yes gene_type:complete